MDRNASEKTKIVVKHLFLRYVSFFLVIVGAAQIILASDGRANCQPATASDIVASATGGATPSFKSDGPSAGSRAESATTATQAPATASTTNYPTVFAFTNSWFATTNWAQRLDWLHDSANFVSERNIQQADGWFISNPTSRVAFRPAKFRLGLQVEGDYFANSNNFSFRPLADTESEVHLPNAEKRLRLTISTLDPTALPGQDNNQGMSGFRVGLNKGMLKNIDTSVGVRVKWPPEVYMHTGWDPRYRFCNWDMYPEQKVGWESDNGVYETSSLMFNRWFDRWVIRPIASLKLSRSRYKDDMDKLDQEREEAEAAGLPPPDGNYLKGWDWELTLLGGYAQELIDQSVFGRLAEGSDLAKGGGFRFSALGSLHIVESYNLTLLYRGHLYKSWLYYVIKPNISWPQDNDWEAEYSLTLGIDILIFGTRER